MNCLFTLLKSGRCSSFDFGVRERTECGGRNNIQHDQAIDIQTSKWYSLKT